MNEVRTSHSRTSPLGLGKRLLRQALVHNPLFLLSAALVLVGAWLLNPPTQDGTRSLALLGRLFTAIQAYELCLLGAAAIFARRRGLERDVRSLVLVLAPFVLDATLTTCALLEAMLHFDGPEPYLVALLVVALSVVKIKVAARLAGVRLGLGELLTLLAGPLLVTAFPIVAFTVGNGGQGVGTGQGSGIALAGGLGLAALVVAFEHAASRKSEAAALIRKLSAIALPVAAIHVCATVWSHTGDLLHVLGPLLIAGGSALPRLVWPTIPRDLVTPLALPILGATVLGFSSPDSLFLTAAQWGLVGVVLSHGRELLRTRASRFVFGPLVVVEILKAQAMGASALAHPIGAFEPVVFASLFAYALRTRAHPAWIGSSLAVTGILVRLAGFTDTFDVDVMLGAQTIGVGALAWAHRGTLGSTSAAKARLVGTFALVLPAYLAWMDTRGSGGVPLVLGGAATFGLLVLWRRTGHRVYGLPLVLVPAYVSRSVPRASTAAWGVLGLGFAFVAVALGVVTTLGRDKILAWIGEVEA